MTGNTLEKKEKKVEYIELVYDLIFVYMIGRNNSILHSITNGFVDGQTFMNYIFCTFAVIQMWTMTTYYINVYGRHSVRDHVMMFVNMFLLYFMGEGTGSDRREYHSQYHIAWALILLNIALQYVIEYRRRKDEPRNKRRILGMACVILCEAALIVGSVFEYGLFKTSYLSIGAIGASILVTAIMGRDKGADLVDFAHLSERAMLYVVFTFGEMIISLAGYFDGSLSLNSLYFSAMGFLIVVSLLLSYGLMYDNLIDREMKTNGIGYMIIHIFIVFSLNNITAALSFMQNEQVDLIAKILFITLSLILYYVCLGFIRRYAKREKRPHTPEVLKGAALSVLFASGMFLFKDKMYINIALTVLFVFALFGFMYVSAKKTADKKGKNI